MKEEEEKDCCEFFVSITSTAQPVFIHQMLKNIVELTILKLKESILWTKNI